MVYDPRKDDLYHAIKGSGSYKNVKPWKVERTKDFLTYVTDRKLKDTPRAAEIKTMLHERAKELSLAGVKEVSGAYP